MPNLFRIEQYLYIPLAAIPINKQFLESFWSNFNYGIRVKVFRHRIVVFRLIRLSLFRLFDIYIPILEFSNWFEQCWVANIFWTAPWDLSSPQLLKRFPYSLNLF